MNNLRFDQLTRFAASRSRRSVLKTALGLLSGSGIAVYRGADIEAATCRGPGTTCREHGNCCSGICGADARGRKFCQCPSGQKECKGSCIPQSACCAHGDCVGVETQCLSGRCDANKGQCYTVAKKGTVCTTDDLCAVGAVCQYDGTCAGTPRSCDDLVTSCHDASCDPTTGECVQSTKQDGTICGGNGEHCCSGDCRLCCDDAECVADAPANSVPMCTANGCTYPCETGYHECNGICASDADPATCGSRCSPCPDSTPFCDGQNCVECLNVSDCPASSEACAVAVCTNGFCGFGPAEAGTVCGTATAICEANPTCDGATTTCPSSGGNAADGTPCDDGDPCTNNTTCTAGVCGGGTTVANCETCTVDADCGVNAFNPCQIRYCGENGRCAVSYLSAGLICPSDDECIDEPGTCTRGAVQTTFCSGSTTIQHPACTRTCTVGETCTAASVGSCQKSECLYYSQYDRGGCVVVNDTSRNGQSCTAARLEPISQQTPPDSWGLFCLEGTCDNGVCVGQEEKYPPNPETLCCFNDSGPGTGRPNGADCTEDGQCCSNSCVNGLCATT